MKAPRKRSSFKIKIGTVGGRRGRIEDDREHLLAAPNRKELLASEFVVSLVPREQEDIVEQYDFWKSKAQKLEQSLADMSQQVLISEHMQRAQETKREHDDQEIMAAMKIMKHYIDRLEKDNAALAESLSKRDQSDNKSIDSASSDGTKSAGDTKQKYRRRKNGVHWDVVSMMAKQIGEMKRENQELTNALAITTKDRDALLKDSTRLVSKVEELQDENDRLATKCKSLEYAALALAKKLQGANQGQHTNVNHTTAAPETNVQEPEAISGKATQEMITNSTPYQGDEGKESIDACGKQQVANDAESDHGDDQSSMEDTPDTAVLAQDVELSETLEISLENQDVALPVVAIPTDRNVENGGGSKSASIGEKTSESQEDAQSNPADTPMDSSLGENLSFCATQAVVETVEDDSDDNDSVGSTSNTQQSSASVDDENATENPDDQDCNQSDKASSVRTDPKREEQVRSTSDVISDEERDELGPLPSNPFASPRDGSFRYSRLSAQGLTDMERYIQEVTAWRRANEQAYQATMLAVREYEARRPKPEIQSPPTEPERTSDARTQIFESMNTNAKWRDKLFPRVHGSDNSSEAALRILESMKGSDTDESDSGLLC